MCLAVPMKVMATDGLSARCEARGESRCVSLWLLQHDLPVVGDQLLVHLGQALRKLSDEDAALTWSLFDEMLAVDPAAVISVIPNGA